MKNIIDRTRLAVNPHVIREGKTAYAIFTGYSEGYRAMIEGLWNGRVVRITDAQNMDDAEVLNMALFNPADLPFSGVKVLRRGHTVR